jgi:hypothetical protein
MLQPQHVVRTRESTLQSATAIKAKIRVRFPLRRVRSVQFGFQRPAPDSLFPSVESRNHCGDFQKHPRRVNVGQLGVELPNLSFESVNCQESKVCESFPLQFLFCRLRFSGRSCDNLPSALPRYGWIQGFSYVREGSTGRPNMERLSHLPNSLDGLRVAFLSHFFTFSWRQPVLS